MPKIKYRKALFILMSTLISALFLQSCSPKNKSEQKSTNVISKKEQHSYNFGKLKKGETHGHTFEFVNRTGKALKLLNHRIPCGCAAIKMFPSELQPGEKAKIRVQFDTSKYLGKVEKKFYVLTNSKNIPVVTYSLTAEVIPPSAPACSVKPFIDMHLVSTEKTYNLQFDIKNKGNKNLLIKKTDFQKITSIKLKTQLPLTILPGKTEALKIIIKTPKNSGKFHQQIILKTNDPHIPSLLLLIKGDAKNDT